jgi:hypothetical protein
VIQPSEEGAHLLRREAGAGDWEALSAPPAAFDLSQEILLFRPYGGYTTDHIFERPYLTEDDYVHDLGQLEGALQRDLANAALGNLSFRPALFIGLSMYEMHHRILLHRLFPRGVPRGSVVVLDPRDAERSLWERGAGLPGDNEGAEVVESTVEDIAATLGAAGGDR